jgi:hypothetical protein
MHNKDRKERLLAALAAVRSGGTRLDPRWDPYARYGFAYRGNGCTLDEATLLQSLEELADQEYLERVFLERVMLCPSCGSHAVNIHEACLSCGSSNLVLFRALFHFRCGFVGPVSAFRPESQGRRCPKCAKILADLGTDHDSPGDFFRCRSCGSRFQEPEIGARCLSCGGRFTGRDLQATRHRDVFGYSLTSLGATALDEQRLLDDPAEAFRANGLLATRDTIIDRIETLRRERATTGEPFGTVVIALRSALTFAEVESLQREFSTNAEVGRLDAKNVVLLLPGYRESSVTALCARFNALNDSASIRAEVLSIEDGDEVRDVLAFAIGASEANV